jgi:signal transduction histidine kinase
VTAGSPPRWPLRWRLAALGLVGVLVPLAVLLAVSLVSEETQTTDAAADVTERTRGLSPWVPVTAALLAVPAAAAAWWWAGRAVGPIRRITAVADEIQATSLDRRIHLTDAPAEVQALADSFDRMLDRLAAASDVQRRLIEDTSHQLRTPLAVLAANADVALADRDAGAVELREAVQATRDTVDRLRALVDDLLAEARARHHTAARSGNDLAAIARAAGDTYGTMARARGVALRLEAPDRLPAAVDGGPVGRAVGCLVDNAVRHAPPGTTVDLAVGTDGDRAFVAVTDAGPGIAPAHHARMFDRYWTGGTDARPGDPPKAKAPGGPGDEGGRDGGDGGGGPGGGGAPGEGLGIGLSVVKQVADAHEGVEVASPLGPDGGTRVTLWFRT